MVKKSNCLFFRKRHCNELIDEIGAQISSELDLDRTDIRMLKTLRNQIGVALHNSRVVGLQ